VHNCDQVLEHIYDIINNNKMTPELSGEVRQHLSLCRACYSKLEFEQRLMDRLKAANKCICPDSLKNKIKSIVENF